MSLIRVVLLFFLIGLAACNLTDSFSEEPMFLEIESATLVSDGDTYPSHKIQDVSVYVDGVSVGVFELPARVPVLGEGEVSVVVFAGIRNNGQVLSPKEYPFYKRQEFIIPFEANKIISLSLEYEYLEDTKFVFDDNFESEIQFNLDLDEDEASTLVKSSDTPYGSFCGLIDVTQETSFFLQATVGRYNVEDFQGSQVYLELDYKCEVPFIVGYIGFDGAIQRSETFIVLFESEEWDKVYLDMSVVLNGGEFDTYRIFLAGVGDMEAGRIWVDNVRLVHL